MPPKAAAPAGTVILEPGESPEDLVAKLDPAMEGVRAGRHRVVLLCPDGGEARLRQALPERLQGVEITAREDWWRRLRIATPWVGYLPAATEWSRPRWDLMPPRAGFLRLWIPPLIPTMPDGAILYERATAWIATVDLLPRMFAEGARDFGIGRVIETLLLRQVPIGYASTPGAAPRSGPPAPGPAGRLRRDARVRAIVPHHRCEPWLEQCLRSLTRQTRPPEAIVVVDDGSPSPPSDIVARFPAVTLLRARDNAGPYRLVQTVIDGTDFDAYLLQDADDWSTDDRLELQLAEAERTGAELVGTQELRLDFPPGGATAVCYPLDASSSFRRDHDCQLLHPTSLVSRDLVQRIGGYSSGCRFGADLEFQLRAHHAARVVNIASFCYFRRHRPGSLWTSPETGEHSRIRYDQDQRFLQRAIQNAERVAAGGVPDLTPLNRVGPAALDHIIGPPLRLAPG